MISVIEIIKHGTSTRHYFSCIDCGCQYVTHKADCFVEIKRVCCDCPECGFPNTEKEDDDPVMEERKEEYIANRKLVYADDAKRHIKDYGTGILDLMPAVDAAPVIHGHWVKDSSSGFWQCEECNMLLVTMPISYYKPAYKFCPYCGAKMDEEEENATD